MLGIGGTNGDVDFLEHCYAFNGILKCDILGCGDDDCAYLGVNGGVLKASLD